jgi:hypothetical protein
MTINSKLFFMILKIFFSISNNDISKECDKRCEKN